MAERLQIGDCDRSGAEKIGVYQRWYRSMIEKQAAKGVLNSGREETGVQGVGHMGAPPSKLSTAS